MGGQRRVEQHPSLRGGSVPPKNRPFAAPGTVPALGALVSFGAVGCLARLALGPTIAGLLLSLGVGTCLYLLMLHHFGSSLAFGSLAASFRIRTGGESKAHAHPPD